MLKLNLRRAIFVYEGARLAARAAEAPIVPVQWSHREQGFKDQFLVVIEKQCGPNRCPDPVQLHEEWVVAYNDMGWHYGPVYDLAHKIHPDMVPYAELGELERDKDDVFVALCDIARKWIYDAG